MSIRAFPGHLLGSRLPYIYVGARTESCSVSDTVPLTGEIGNWVTMTLPTAESLGLSAESPVLMLWRLWETWALADAYSPQIDVGMVGQDTQAITDVLRYAFPATGSDGLALVATTAARRLALLAAAEALALVAPATARLDLLARSVETLSATDSLRSLVSALAPDGFATVETATARTLAYPMAQELVGLAAILRLSLHATARTTDALASTDAVRWTAHAPVLESLILETLTEAQTANVLRMLEWLAVATTSSAVVDLLASTPEALGLNDVLVWLAQGLLADQADMTDTAVVPVTVSARLLDLAGLRAQPAVQTTLLGALVDRVATTDALRYAAQALIADGLSLETLTQEQTVHLVLMAEALGIGATPAVRADLLGLLVERLVANDVAAFAWGLSAEDTAGLAETLQAAVASFLVAPDTLAIIEDVRSALVVVGEGADVLTGVDQLGASLSVALRAPDTLAFVGVLPLAEGDFQAWVVNTDTLGATSYANFPFNSLYSHQGTTWGVTETGLYELTGDTDDGEPIAALLRTGMLDFDTSWIKGVPRCYLHLHSDGRAILKTIGDNEGVRTEHWYAVHAVTGDAGRVRPLRLGRGLRFIAMAFELVNVDGSSLDLSGVEVLPVMLRRV